MHGALPLFFFNLRGTVIMDGNNSSFRFTKSHSI